MQKKVLSILTIMLITVLFALPQQGYGFGMGIYVPFGTGSGTFTLTDLSDVELNYDGTYAGGFGIVLDTKIARDGLFNYRLNLGVINGSNTYEGGTEQNGYKYYTLDNSFGFGVVRTSWLRLWIGPQIRIAYMNMEDNSNGYTEKINGVGFGFAPVIGANFNFGPVFTAALDLGFRFSSYAGTWDYEGYNEYSGYYDTWNESFTRSENMFFINFSLLFRMGDNYDNAEDFF